MKPNVGAPGCEEKITSVVVCEPEGSDDLNARIAFARRLKVVLDGKNGEAGMRKTWSEHLPPIDISKAAPPSSALAPVVPTSLDG
jgi:hypothetical protein